MTWQDLLNVFSGYIRRKGLRSSEFHAVDKRIPVPPGMCKNPANNGINSRSNGAGFLPSTACLLYACCLSLFSSPTIVPFV